MTIKIEIAGQVIIEIPSEHVRLIERTERSANGGTWERKRIFALVPARWSCTATETNREGEIEIQL